MLFSVFSGALELREIPGSLRRMEKNIAVRDLVFDRTSFWVQIHDLPVGDMNPEATAKIGKVCGEVQQGIQEWGNQKPNLGLICRGRKLHHEDRAVGYIKFKYEWLPSMCYWCGRLSHKGKDCELWVRSNGSLTKSDRQFGS